MAAMFEEAKLNDLKSSSILCVKEPSVINLKRFTSSVEALDTSSLKILLNYVVFPLKILLGNAVQKSCTKINEQALVEIITCLQTVFAKVELEDFDTFGELYVNLFQLLDEQANEKKVSEDVKNAAINAVCVLIESCSSSAFEKLFEPQFRPILGHSISILLNLTSTEKYFHLRRGCIKAIYLLVHKSQSNAGNEQDSVDVLAWFLPGIITRITRFILQDEKIQSQLIVSSLALLEEILCCTLGNTSDRYHSKSEELIITRNEKWMKDCASNVGKLLQKLIPKLSLHSSSETRKALLQMACAILLKCSPVFLETVVEELLKVPLICLNDSSNELSSVAESCIKEISCKTLCSSRVLSDVINDSMYDFLMKFPRYIRCGDDALINSNVVLLNGYVSCLGSANFTMLMSLPFYKEKLLQCLLDLIEFDFKESPFVENIDVIGGHKTSLDFEPSISFKHFQDLKVEGSIKTLCRNLVKNLERNHISDITSELTQVCTSNSISLCNYIMEEVRDLDLIMCVCKDYLCRINSLETALFVEKTKYEDIRKAYCLIYGLGVLSKHISDSPETVKYEVINLTVFPLIVLSGSPNKVLSNVSQKALNKLAQAFGYSARMNLVLDNLTYINNCIVLQLKRNEKIVITEYAMNVTFTCVSLKTLHQFKAVLNTALDLLDFRANVDCAGFIRIFKIFMTTISRDIEIQKPPSKIANSSNNLNQNFTALVTNLFSGEEQLTPVEETQSVPENTNCQVPPHVDMVVKILQNLRHTIAHKDPQVRLLTISTISYGLEILKAFDDQLLPLVHQLWDPLIVRFRDKETMVIRYAFRCLLTMASCSRSFIRVRFAQHILPQIVTFLKQQEKSTYRKKRETYFFTSEYKVLLEILKSIGELMIDLDVEGKDLWTVLFAIMPYMNKYQPKELQEAAESSVTMIKVKDSCSTWYFAQQFCGSEKRYIKDNFPSFVLGGEN